MINGYMNVGGDGFDIFIRFANNFDMIFTNDHDLGISLSFLVLFFSIYIGTHFMWCIN